MRSPRARPGRVSDEEVLADLAWAAALLTRLPVAGRDGREPVVALAASVWAYPVVGAGVGALGGGLYAALAAIGLSPLLGAVLALAATVAATGALHEDGLADTADGFGGGATPRAQARDHAGPRHRDLRRRRSLVALALRAGAILALHEPGRVLVALVVAGALSRAGMTALMGMLPPARRDGLAAAIARPGPALVGAALAVALVPVLLLLPAAPALTCVGLSALACGAVGWLARRQIGGVTGDVLGAAQQAAECAALVALSVALA